MTPKERIYATIKAQPTDRPAVTPIFMAWAANFIGRPYRDYYLDGDVLVEAQLAVTKAFNVDQISAISDPWREASAYGMAFDYPPDGVGKPKALLLQSKDDASKVRPLDLKAAPRTAQRIESVAKMAHAVGDSHSVLGWVEGPLAEYADLRGVETAMYDLIDDPDFFADVAERIVANEIAFALAQVEAGADMIGMGDAACSLVGPDVYGRHILPLEKEIIDAIHNAGAAVKLHICGNINPIIALMARTGTDIIDADWMVPLDTARAAVGPDVTLCGNFDPTAVLLQGSPQTVADAARDCIAKAGPPFILMPGCEVPPATPQTNIRAFCPCEGCLIPTELNL
ncbi:MAG TPA: uroporphyrinogen decarboxylase [Phycisphaerales bacterium]|nr:uroporphyrinogen decarboxylase [Phycisphaerales bacterium]